MCFLDSCLPRYHEKLFVAIKDGFNILGTERDHGPVVKNDIGEERISLFVRILDGSLVKLKFGHTKSTDHH